MNAIRPPTERPLRQDGELARERLRDAALSLFAQKGYARTATREIAEAAHTNLGAISYYFGDKAGLYRAVFFSPMAQVSPVGALAQRPDVPLAEVLRLCLGSFLEPLALGAQSRQFMALQMREMLEPTGVWLEHIDHDIRPLHEALVHHLCRHFQLDAPDAAVQRLAVCIAGLGVHLHVGREVTDALAPELNAAPDALVGWRDTLLMYAQAMVDAEAQRRGVAPPCHPCPDAPGGPSA